MAIAAGKARPRGLWLTVGASGGVAALIGFGTVLASLTLRATGHAYFACLIAMVLYAALRVGLAAVSSLFIAARCRAGSVTPGKANQLAILRQWCPFAAGAAATILPAVRLPAWS